MSSNHLLLILTRWKSEAYASSHQLELMKKEHQQKLLEVQHERNSIRTSTHSILINNEDILHQLLINVDQSSISDQLSVLCQFFVDSLKSLLLSNTIEEKQHSTRNSSLIIQNIETNIQQIGHLINRMNKNCSNNLIINSCEK